MILARKRAATSKWRITLGIVDHRTEDATRKDGGGSDFLGYRKSIWVAVIIAHPETLGPRFGPQINSRFRARHDDSRWWEKKTPQLLILLFTKKKPPSF